MKRSLLLILLGLSAMAFGDEVTLTCVNFAAASFDASAAGLNFSNCQNVLATNNTNGKSIMLSSVDSGSTGAALTFVAGPPLEADYHGAGADSVLVETGTHVYLSGMMEDSGRLEAQYPNRAGAFLSRFTVTSVDPMILLDLGTTTRVAPEGSVSLTVAQTSFDGTSLHATLGGAEYTIETEAPVAESATLLLFGTGTLAAVWTARNRMKSTI